MQDLRVLYSLLRDLRFSADDVPLQKNRSLRVSRPERETVVIAGSQMCILDGRKND